MVLKKILLIFLSLSILLSVSYAGESPHPEQIQKEELSFWDKIQRGDIGLTIQGQQEGCSVYPDAVRKNIYFDLNAKRDPYDLLLSDRSQVDDNGKVNIYVIRTDGSWDFIEEIDYEQSYIFLKEKRYAVEFYNCPQEQQEQMDIEDYQTSDGYQHGDIICKGGSYLAEVNFNSEGQVSYDKVESCSCTTSVCDNTQESEQEPQVYTHDESGEILEEWSSQDLDEEYERVREQIQDTKINLTELNEVLEEQRQEALQEGNVDKAQELENEQKKLQKQLSGVEKDLDSSSSGTIIIGLLLILGLSVALWRWA